jgi:galactokinase
VEQVKTNDNVVGARMMGGGFGGCTINIVKETGVPEMIEKVSTAYKTQLNKELKSYIAVIADGTTVLTSN